MQVAVVLAIRVVEEVLLIFLWKLHGSMYYSCITVRPVRQNPFYLSCSPLAPWPSFSRYCSLHIASFPPAVSGSFLCARARSFPALTLISQRDRRRAAAAAETHLGLVKFSFAVSGPEAEGGYLRGRAAKR